MAFESKLVVIGASAGGVEALREIARSLAPRMDAAVVVVLHTSPGARSALREILARVSGLEVAVARDGQPIAAGCIVVAPPDKHLTIVGDTLRISRGPRVNGHRPAIDPLFRSAAHFHGERVIGVVLSGALDDGTAGMLSVRRAGGACLVQSPEDAQYESMPASALRHLPGAEAFPAAELGREITALAGTRAADVRRSAPNPVASETRGTWDVWADTLLPHEIEADEARHGAPPALTCPDCHGALWELHEGSLVRYTCHVGHTLTADVLLGAQGEKLEAALWSAFRALRERAGLADKLAARARAVGQDHVARTYEERRAEAAAHAAVLRELLEQQGPPVSG